jgi:beta-lactamase regulating signal transducer with metallopeptidase domain
MDGHLLAWRFLANAAVGGTIVLVSGSLAAWLCKRPAERARVVVLTILGGLAVPWVGYSPVAPRWSAGLVPASLALPVPAAHSRASEVTTVQKPTAPSIANSLSTPTLAGVKTGRTARPHRPETRDRVAASPVGQIAPAPFRRIAGSWPLIALVSYAAASAGMMAWWLAGQVLLWRVRRAARPVTPQVHEMFRAIAGPAGQAVVLLESDLVKSPFTYTWAQPVVVLPTALCAVDSSQELRFCLAHEWSHIERRDALAWNLAALGGFVLFYQPLFWWLRRQLRLCQDYLADDKAAALASAEDYAIYLVRLARARSTVCALPALGVGDRRTNLFRRVAMLVGDHEPLAHHCRARWSVAGAISAAVVIVIVSGLRLDAAPAAAGSNSEERQAGPAGPHDKPKNQAKPKDEAPKPETLHYTGMVKEIGTGKPIVGAAVVVRRSVLKPGNNENKILEESKHTTDADGRYSFTIPPEQVAEKSLYIELDVEHPDYATQAGFGYALGMIRKNEQAGGRPFFENIELRPGKPIMGHVERPDGSPAKGVSILAFSKSGKLASGENFEYGSFSKAKSDDAGNFKVNVTTPGPAVFWILPDDLAGELHGVPDGKRGDLGRFTLKQGVSLKGRVLDVESKPIAGIFVNAEFEGDDRTNQILGGLAVANAINRSAVTGADGSFTLAPLPSGSYRVLPGDRASDGSERNKVRPLRAVFTPRKITLREGETPEPMEVRASPHVVIEAQWLDSKGKPTWGFESHIFGQVDGGHWFGQANIVKDGKAIAEVPHGLENVQLNLMTNEHHAIRWRKAKGEPLSRGRMIMLGTLDHDVKGIEIIHYSAPIVIVKGETTDKKPVPGLKVSAQYTQPEKNQAMGKLILAGGVESDVSFEKQEDGRFRSSQLQPDIEFSVKAEADGFKPASHKLTIAEGKNEEITLVLEPK